MIPGCQYKNSVPTPLFVLNYKYQKYQLAFEAAEWVRIEATKTITN